jgi:hypothetical protein
MERRIKNLGKKILDEHYKITSNPEAKNSNIMWMMYLKGAPTSKAGMIKPWMFLAEAHLLMYLGYMDKYAVENLVNLIKSPDKDNLFVASQVIKFYRNLRIKELGEFDKKKSKYREVIRDYDTKILNADMWQQYKKLKAND